MKVVLNTYKDTDENLSFLFQMLADEKVIRFVRDGNVWPKEAIMKIHEVLSHEFNSDYLPESFYAGKLLQAKENGKVITVGVIGFSPCDYITDETVTQIFIVIHPDYWGEGVASQCVKEALDWFDDTCNANLIAYVHPDNIAINKLLCRYFELVEKKSLAVFGGREYNIYCRSK